MPRPRHQCLAVALAALAMAFVHLSNGTVARAQGTGLSPFQPSLTDPRNAQCSSSPILTTGATAAGARPATAKEILPPSGAGETGFDFHRRDRQKQAADEHDSAPQIKVRAPCANTYKPPDAPVRRPSVPLQDAFEPMACVSAAFY